MTCKAFMTFLGYINQNLIKLKMLQHRNYEKCGILVINEVILQRNIPVLHKTSSSDASTVL